MLRAVTFDYWRTLIWEPPGELERMRLEHWAGILTEIGCPVAASDLAAAHEAAFQQASDSWRRGEQYRVEHATVAMLGHLHLELPADIQHRLVDAFSAAGRVTALETAGGVGEALDELRAAGLRIGIICDVGLTPSPVLLEHLDNRGLLTKFDHWSFSDEVGAYKPDRRPFDHALAGLGVSAAEAAHVGDQRRTDVVGAIGAGWLAVRYAGVFDDQDDSLPEAPVVVHDHRALPEMLHQAPRYSGRP